MNGFVLKIESGCVIRSDWLS